MKQVTQDGDKRERIPVIVYAVKSSPDPKDSTGSQIQTVEEHVARLNEHGDQFRPGERFAYAEAFREENQSGWKKNRGPQLEAALAAARRAEAQHGYAELWVAITSRLGRGSGKKGAGRSYMKLWADTQAEGIQLRAVADDQYCINQSFVGIASEQSNKYVEDLSANVKRGKRTQWANGERLGGPVPDGYDRAVTRDPRTDKVIRTEYPISATRGPVLRRLFELAESGLAPGNVARRLNAEGHRTGGGTAWTRRRIEDTISNAFYAGMVTRNRGTTEEEVRPGCHDALIEPERLARIRAMLPARDKAGSDRKPGRPNSRHAIRNAVCARCRKPMYPRISTYTRVDGSQARTYQCRHYADSTGLCDAPPIDAERVDAALLAHLGGFFIDFPAWLAKINSGQSAERDHAEQQIETETAAVRKAETSVEKLHAALADALANGEAAMSRVLPRTIERGEKALRQAQRRLRTAEAAFEAASAPTPVDDLLDIFNDLAAAVRGKIEGAASLLEVNAELGAWVRMGRGCGEGGSGSVRMVAVACAAMTRSAGQAGDGRSGLGRPVHGPSECPGALMRSG